VFEIDSFSTRKKWQNYVLGAKFKQPVFQQLAKMPDLINVRLIKGLFLGLPIKVWELLFKYVSVCGIFRAFFWVISYSYRKILTVKTIPIE
jgi:hypothetical protein